MRTAVAFIAGWIIGGAMVGFAVFYLSFQHYQGAWDVPLHQCLSQRANWQRRAKVCEAAAQNRAIGLWP